MRLQIKLFYTLLIMASLFSACKEEQLVASDPKPQYVLPQGNHDYDKRIVAFYQKYKSFILYKFSEADFNWNVTSRIKYVATEGDPNYVEKSLNFLDKELFNYYDPQLLTSWMPYKILLCKNIHQLDQESKPLPEFADAAWTFTHIAFGHTDARWDTLTDTQKKRARGILHGALWATVGARKKIQMAPKFIAGIDYTWIDQNNYQSFGAFRLLNTAHEDLAEYVARITGYTKAEMDALFLNDTFDPTGIFRRKYNAVIDFYKTNYKIDLQAIGNSNIH
ncbi:MAG: hypothetical protein LBF27_08940 [Sphingobacterium sp.]|jgi:hypothetical protein|nr:hypothetical protein [Sphingobacterium sp.]